MSEFKVVKDGLSRKSFVKALHLENDYYYITIFYVGDYIKDKEYGNIQQMNISLVCKPKGDYLMLECQEGKRVVCDGDMLYITLDTIDKILYKLQAFKESAKSLEQVLYDIFWSNQNNECTKDE